jgi:hypothetical protein
VAKQHTVVCHSEKSAAKVINKSEFSTADLSGIHLKTRTSYSSDPGYKIALLVKLAIAIELGYQ